MVICLLEGDGQARDVQNPAKVGELNVVEVFRRHDLLSVGMAVINQETVAVCGRTPELATGSLSGEAALVFDCLF